jgi:plasmid stabilization system protein ParE
MRKVFFRSEAKSELFHAVNYYDCQRKKLGNEFLEKVNQHIEKIIENPLLYPIVINNARRCIIKDFPYSVFYRTTESGNICILHIVHQRRNSLDWLTMH